jgi:AcrR family transcriptional regulator
MARGRAKQDSRTTATSEATQARILEATLETIRQEGILGASARAIARTGKFNQASIYYHFGSINDAVLAAVRQMSDERLASYERRLARVDAVAELARVGAELYREDMASGRIKVLSQVMAGAASDEGFAKELAPIFEPWLDVVRATLHRVLGTSGLGAGLPVDDLAFAVSALFIGVELFGQTQDDRRDPVHLFAAFEGLARLADVALASLTIPLLSQDGGSTGGRSTVAKAAQATG